MSDIVESLKSLYATKVRDRSRLWTFLSTYVVASDLIVLVMISQNPSW
jgi:hypothetical protein